MNCIDIYLGVEMSVYPILLHTGACLWYVFFWNNFLSNGSNQKESDWDPRYRDIHEMGSRFLTNWNLVNNLMILIFICFYIYIPKGQNCCSLLLRIYVDTILSNLCYSQYITYIICYTYLNKYKVY